MMREGAEANALTGLASSLLAGVSGAAMAFVVASCSQSTEKFVASPTGGVYVCALASQFRQSSRDGCDWVENGVTVQIEDGGSDDLVGMVLIAYPAPDGKQRHGWVQGILLDPIP